MTRRGKKRLFLLIAALGLCGLGAAGLVAFRDVYREQRAQASLDRGLAAYEVGDYEAALPDLSYYLARHNDDLETLLIFADTRAKVPEPNGQHLRSAIRLHVHALQLDPRNKEALEGLLDLYQRTGRRVELMDTARAMLEIDPDHHDALASLTWGLSTGARYSEALEYAERLCALEPQNYGWHALYLDNLRLSGASDDVLVQKCDEWIENDSVKDGRFHLLKAVTLSSLGHTAEAEATAKKASELGAARDVFDELVQILDGFGLRSEADAVIARSIEEQPSAAWVYEAAVRREWQAGRLSDARRRLDEAEEALGSERQGLARMRALLYVVTGEKEKALKAVELLFAAAEPKDPDERDADRAWANALEARLNVDDSNWAEALAAYDKAHSLNPNDAILHYLRGEAYFAVGEYDVAAAAFNRAVSLEQMWIAAGVAHVESLLRLGRIQDAHIAALDLVGRTSPTILEPYLLWARTWLAMEEAGIAAPPLARRAVQVDLVSFIETLYEQANRAPEIAPLLVRAYRLQGRQGEIASIAQDVLAAENVPASTDLRFAYISIDERLGLEKEFVDRAEATGGRTPATALLQARILHQAGKTAEGLALLDELLETSTDEERHDAVRARLEYLVVSGQPGVAAYIDTILESEQPDADALGYILTLDEAWKTEERIGKVVDRLAQLVGERSMRVKLAEAGRTLRFDADSGEALAQAALKVDDVLRQSPDSLPALTMMASLLLEGPDPDPQGAIEHLRRAVDQYPNQTEIYPRLIRLLQQTGDYATAERYLAQFGRRRDINRSLAQEELQLLQSQGRFDAAIARLSGMLDESATEYDRLTLAALSLKAGRTSEAETIVRELLQAENPGPLTLQFAANFYALQGRSPEGLELLQNARIEGGEGARALLLGTFYHQQGFNDQAEVWLEKAVKQDPKNAGAWLVLAQHHLAAGNHEEARRAAVAGLEYDPENEGLRMALASASLVADPAARAEAINTFRELQGDNTALVDTVVFFDEVAEGGESLSTSPAHLRKARELVERHPTFLPAWRLAVMLHVAAGKRIEAIDLARQAILKSPTEAEPAQWALELYLSNNQLPEALQMAQTWRARTLENPIEADASIAQINLMRRDASGAYQTLSPHSERIRREQARYPDRFNLWLRTLLLTNRIGQAAALISKDAPEISVWLPTWFETTRALDGTEAAAALRAVEPFCKASPGYTLDLAVSWMILGERDRNPAFFDEAERLALVLSADDATRMMAMAFRAMLSDARGEHEQAVAIYKAVLEEDSADQIALNNLAFLLSQKLNRPDEAIEYSSRAVDLYPDKAEMIDTHALVLLSLNRLDEAEESARRAIAMRPSDPGIMMTMLRVLIAQDRQTEAANLLRETRQVLARAPYRDPELEATLDTIRQQLDSSS